MHDNEELMEELSQCRAHREALLVAFRELKGEVISVRENVNSGAEFIVRNSEGIEALSKRMSQFELYMKEAVKQIRGFRAAFANDDLDGHRAYHQSVIEWHQLRNKIVRESLVKAAQTGFVVGAGWICYALWMAFKMSVTK